MTNHKDFSSKQFKKVEINKSHDSSLSSTENEFDGFLSASHVLQNNNTEKFSTGSCQLNKILGGGIETGSIIQFYGSPGSGKSQICYTICALMPKQNRSIYIDTEAKFRAERIMEIIKDHT